MPRRRSRWFVEYHCGCRETRDCEEELTGYCEEHGDEPRFEPFKVHYRERDLKQEEKREQHG